jgi:hypothetical protein
MDKFLSFADLPPSFQFVLNAVLCTLRPHDTPQQTEMERELAIGAFLAIGPRDALEAMWAGQAVAMSHAAMAEWMEVGRPGLDPDAAARHRRDAVRLSKTGAQMVRLIQSRRRQAARAASADSENNPIAAALAGLSRTEVPATPAQASAPASAQAPARPSAPVVAQAAARPQAPVTAKTPATAGAEPAGRRPVPAVAACSAGEIAAVAAAALGRSRTGAPTGLPELPGMSAAVASAAAALSRAGLLNSVALPNLPEAAA